MSTRLTHSSRLKFNVVAKDPWSEARAAEFSTSHGIVETPIFMPVATQAALRGVDTAAVDSLGFQVLLANTYHLLLRPGPETFERIGGIHKFMDWRRAVLTDSGGYQIFSLAHQLKLSEEGARFRSYIDGREFTLTPESSIAMQRSIGSDIMMVLDHCIDSTSDEAAARSALELTTRWARRSFDARGDSDQALFGIVQGACFPSLRRESASRITEIPFDGFALGGLAVGETKSEREDMVELAAPLLPSDRPRYLMGVGTPIDLLEAVKRGVDMFDCIIPTAFAHQGNCYTSTGRVELGRGAFKNSQEPLDPECGCSTCKRFTRAYLHHIVRAKEYVADQLLGLHNLTFYRELMRRMRCAIVAGEFKKFYEYERERLVMKDMEHPVAPPKPSGTPREKLRLGDYEILVHEKGYGAIKQCSSGEVMHSVVDPGEESLALYVQQSRILLDAQTEGDPIFIWDVGLGAATNAMVCIRELEALPALRRDVNIISFERDLDPLRLALTQVPLFRHLRHAAPRRLLKEKEWKNAEKRISWTLVTGDFSEQSTFAPAPNIIWYDPFSYKVDAELWSTGAFRRLFSLCERHETRLYTYTASTAVRAGMLAAGWFVGAGVGTGPKTETTVAYSERAARHAPRAALLGAAWLARWEKSGARQPLGSDDASLCERVRQHPQFTLPFLATV